MSDTPTPSPTPQVSSAAAWKQSSGVGAPLVVPSGNVCLVKPMNMQALVRNNIIPNELMDIITGAMKTRQAPSMEQMAEDITPEKLVAIMDVMDDVVLYMVVEPKIHPIPMTKQVVDGEEQLVPAERDPNLLYVDEVDQDDKTFIFQYAVGGTRDLEKFREGLASYVGSLEQESQVAQSTQ